MEDIKEVKLSEEHYAFRTGQAKEIRDALKPFVDDSMGNRDDAQTTVEDTEINIQKGRHAVYVRYVTPDSDPAYQRLHKFGFGYGDGDYLSYQTQRLRSLLYPELLNSTEAIARDEAALSELAWVAKAIMSSGLAKRRQYPEEELHQPMPADFEASE